MAGAHYVEIRAFAQATEDPDLVEDAMRTFLPGDVEVEREEAEGHFGNPIEVLRARFDGADEIRAFLEKIGPLKGKILEELDRRLDDDCNLWLRLDKAAALGGDARTTRDDGLVARIKLEAYPARRENAEESARGLLGD